MRIYLLILSIFLMICGLGVFMYGWQVAEEIPIFIGVTAGLLSITIWLIYYIVIVLIKMFKDVLVFYVRFREKENLERKEWIELHKLRLQKEKRESETAEQSKAKDDSSKSYLDIKQKESVENVSASNRISTALVSTIGTIAFGFFVIIMGGMFFLIPILGWIFGPLIMLGGAFCILASPFFGMLGFQGYLQGECPYCGGRVSDFAFKDSAKCSTCDRIIVINNKKFIRQHLNVHCPHCGHLNMNINTSIHGIECSQCNQYVLIKNNLSITPSPNSGNA